MRHSVIASSDGTQTESIDHFCGPCGEKIRTEDAQRSARIQQQVRESFADGSAFAQMRLELATVVERGDPAGLASAAEFLDFMASAQPVPLPDDLQDFADRHRVLRPPDWPGPF